MVTLELSDREAKLLAGVIDDAILDASIEVDILMTHYPSESTVDIENDLDTLYGLSNVVDNALWAVEVDA